MSHFFTSMMHQIIKISNQKSQDDVQSSEQSPSQSISIPSYNRESTMKYEIERMEHHKLRMEHEIQTIKRQIDHLKHSSTKNVQTDAKIYQYDSRSINYTKDLHHELTKLEIQLKDHCNEIKKRQVKYKEHTTNGMKSGNKIKKACDSDKPKEKYTQPESKASQEPNNEIKTTYQFPGKRERFFNLWQHKNEQDFINMSISRSSGRSSSLQPLFDLCARAGNYVWNSLAQPIIQIDEQVSPLHQQPKCDIFISCTCTNNSIIEHIKTAIPQYFSIHIKTRITTTNIKCFLDNTGTAVLAYINKEYELDSICQADLTHIFKRQFPLILITSNDRFEPTTNWLKIIWNTFNIQKISLNLPDFKTNLKNALEAAQWNLSTDPYDRLSVPLISDDRANCFVGHAHEWIVAYTNAVQVSHSYRQFINDPLRIETDQKLEDIYYKYIQIYFRNTDLISLCEKAYKENDMHHLIRAYTHPSLLNVTLNNHLASNIFYYFSLELYETVDYQLVKCLIDFVTLFIYRADVHQYVFTGTVYRGVVISEEDLFKYVVGSRIMNTTFLSTSKDKKIPEIFAERTQKNITILCSFVIHGKNNRRTALSIEHISWFPAEREVLILPLSAFYIQSVEKSANNSKPIEIVLVEDDTDILENADTIMLINH